MNRNTITSALTGFAMFVFVLAAALPVVWVFMSAFKNPAQMFSLDNLFFFDPTLRNYEETFYLYEFGRGFVNSIIVASSTAALAMLISVPTAYVVARMAIKPKVRDNYMLYILSARLLPPIAFVVPYFILYSWFGLSDTLYGLVMAYGVPATAFSIWMTFGFIQQIPVELEESAMVDGSTRLGALGKIVLPLMLPGLATTIAFCFIFTWNEFALASVLTSHNAVTAPVLINNVLGEYTTNWGVMMAASTIYILPMMIVVYVLQNYIIRGLTFGAVKG